MAESVVSLVVERLAGVIEQNEEINLVVGVQNEVQNLTEKLKMIRAVLEDAEKRKMKEIDVQGWLEQLNGLSYDMDDVLDEWNTAILKYQLGQVDTSSVPKPKLSSCSNFSCFCCNQISIRSNIALKIKEINARLEVIYKEKEQFKFIEGERRDSDVFKSIKTTSLVKESEVDEGECQNVLGSELWKLEVATIKLFPHLYLSFCDVPPAMRPCFIYCAIFPKDIKIVVADLIKLWMAQGYLGTTRSDQEVELRGREYFNDLAMRSFFQDFEHDEFGEEIISCKMHDIVHDFAQYMAGKECLIMQNEPGSNLFDSVQVRHLNWNSSEELTCIPSVFISGKIRSFLADSIPENIFQDLLSNLKHVRTLRLKNADVYEIPKEINALIHLRYLNLSDNPLEELPEEVCDLINLETLDISESGIYELPRTIGKLINLRHLVISESNVQDFPQSLETLTSLRTMDKFVLKKGNKLGWLKNLNHLRGSLDITVDDDVDLVSEKIEMEKAELKCKKHIKKFRLMFYDQVGSDYFGDPAVLTELIDVLGSPPNIEVLYLYAFPTTRLPIWVTSLYNLRNLTIESGEICSSLPPLGRLPRLESLQICNLPCCRHVKRNFLGLEGDLIMDTTNATSWVSSLSVVVAFPKLKKLLIRDCGEWEEWEDLMEEDEKSIIVFPELQDLQLLFCGKLKTLPPRLLGMAKSLESIHIQNCHTFLDQRVKERGLSSHFKEHFMGERRVASSAYFDSNETIGEFLRQLR